MTTERGLGRRLVEHRGLYLLLLPGIILLLLMNYLPMFGIVIAFKNIDYALGLLRSPWVGFQNFNFLFATKTAWTIVRNTLGYNTVFIFTGPVVSIALAIMLNEVTNHRAARIYQSVIILPYFISMIVVGYLLYAFIGLNGYVNSAILSRLGEKPISFYFMPKYWPYLLFFVNGWKNWGIGTVIYLAAMAGFDMELYEAAAIDGANRMSQVFHITVPLLMPIATMMVILSLGRIFYSDFGLFYQVPLSSGTLFPVTQTLDTYTYRALMQLGDTGMAAAAALFQSVVGFVTILGANLLVRKLSPERALF